MPLYQQWRLNKEACIAVWKIEEEVSFFKQHLPPHLHHHFGHIKKQQEFYASRFLLKHLWSDVDFNQIDYDGKKPFTHQKPFHFSISHSFPYVAVVVAHTNVGIDIQCFDEKVIVVRDKFLNHYEKTNFDTSSLWVATTLWTIKESVYKFLGHSMVSFANQIVVEKTELKDDGFHRGVNVSIKNTDFESVGLQRVTYATFGDFVVSYIV